jgi:hypothetical protein
VSKLSQLSPTEIFLADRIPVVMHNNAQRGWFKSSTAAAHSAGRSIISDVLASERPGHERKLMFASSETPDRRGRRTTWNDVKVIATRQARAALCSVACRRV